MEEEQQPFLIQDVIIDPAWSYIKRGAKRAALTAFMLLIIIPLCYGIFMPYGNKAAEQYSPSRLRDILSSIAPYDPPTANSYLHPSTNVCFANASYLAKVPDNCELVHFQLVSRHGTRNPVISQMQKLADLEKQLVSNQQSQWPNWLKNWKSPYNRTNAEQLVRQGVLDLQELAHRDICRYGKWLNRDNTTSLYDDDSDATARHRFAWYASSVKQRCIDSTLAYASVFSGKNLSLSQIQIPVANQDRLLAPHHACPLWEQLSLNKTAEDNMKKPYLESYLPDIIDQLTKIMGYNITKTTYNSMAMACGFEYAIENRADRWCKLLLDSNTDPDSNAHTNIDLVQSKALKLYDFLKDIKFYNKYGMAKKINTRISCVLLSQLVNEMQDVVQGNLSIRWRLRFGHAETIFLLLTLLGVSSEKPEFRQNRALRASRLIPFAANMHFELFKCTNQASAESDNEHFVRVLLNERPIEFPGCKGQMDFVHGSSFTRVLKHILDNATLIKRVIFRKIFDVNRYLNH
ncbi:histidine phosphatase superfamily [Syncephalis fuscata]|nr:histidine phosphatase superfamily [Syncephalis fuscata]